MAGSHLASDTQQTDTIPPGWHKKYTNNISRSNHALPLRKEGWLLRGGTEEHEMPSRPLRKTDVALHSFLLLLWDRKMFSLLAVTDASDCSAFDAGEYARTEH
ncbi:hypothetical protein TRVL_06042 [Trypanosoma vivax]|nr:hypothetical protein TRVL_06042 [Trypanosoma vivax]